MDRQQLLKTLERDLPPSFSRTSVPNFMPGLISSGHLANLSGRGQGPDFIRVGKQVMFEKYSFLEWLDKYLADRIIPSNNLKSKDTTHE